MCNANTATKSMAVNMPIVERDKRASTVGQYNSAMKRLEELATQLKGTDWRIEVCIDGQPFLLVDCPSGEVKPANEPFDRVDCSLTLAPADILQLSAGADVRSFVLYQRVKIRGSIETGIQFCDRLAKRNTKSVVRIEKDLPSLTTDWELAKQQLDDFGYCLIKDALSPNQVAVAHARLVDQAEAEAAIGKANRATGTKSGVPPIQPVFNLINKGQAFVDLLDHPLIDEIIFEKLGEHFLLSSYTSKIAGPGCAAQIMHYDQMGIQPPLPDVNIGLNLFFLLDDFTDANGGTRIVPGSHRPENCFGLDNPFKTDGTIAVEAPARTALIFDTRLWHGTGSNRTNKKRHGLFMLFTRSWLRPIENSTLSIRQSVLDKMSNRIKVMHGFRCTRSAGGVEGPVEGEIVRRDLDIVLPELSLSRIS